MPYTLFKCCLLSLLGLCLCANLSQAQEVNAEIPGDKAQKADEIIQRYIQALGGHESLTQIHSLLIKGKSLGGEFSIKMPTQLVIKNPGKNKLEISVMNQKMVRATDGQISWGVNPFMGKGQPRQIPQFENDTRNNVFYTIGKNLIDYKERGFEAEYLGRISYKGHKAYHLRLKGELHEDEYYIDVKTFLLLMAKVDYSKSHFDNYKKVGNILFPHLIEGEEEDFRMEVEEVILNNQVADAEFEMPFAQFNDEENILLNHAIEEETFDIAEEEHSPEDIIAQYQQQVGSQPTLGQARAYE
ncbi:MAG: hypothetical protein HC913_14825 [Microscillaceae bacterium]|nr:hypothetical protein [Microscillaceae bacterium]